MARARDFHPFKENDMYGYLGFDTGKGLTAAVPAWVTMTKMVSSEEYEVRKKTHLRSLKDLCKNDPDLVGRVLTDFMDILAYVEKDCAEFALHMCVAHHRLPAVHREKRMTTIQRIVDGHFSDLAHPSRDMSNSIGHLKRMAILLPDATLEDELRSDCFAIAFAISELKSPPAGYGLAPITGEILAKLKGSPITKQPELANELSKVWLSRAAAERAAFKEKVLALLEQKKGHAVSAAYFHLLLVWPKTVPLMTSHRFDFYASVISSAADHDDDQWGPFVATHAAAMEAQIRAQADVVLWTSAAAVIEGVSMGPYSASSVEALNKRALVSTGIRGGFTPMRARNARTLGTGDVHKLSEQQALELNTVQSMSVDQLVRWIEGPIVETRQSEKKRIDRKAIVQREQEIRQKATKTKAPSTKDLSPEKPLTDEDVQETIRDAMAATARFFLGEISDMLVLAKSIEVATELVTTCARMEDALNPLIHKPEAFEEEQAREILSHAEAAVAALRKGLKEAQASAVVRSRFPGQLSTALKAESKVLGKRHGGQIACPVRFDDWAYVANTFHCRWLPDVKSIEVDGKAMPLDNDQAAALYVTGSSQSGFAFDVSVHLWRRRQGRTSLPSLENGLYPSMNETDWFDTYQTLCVLHVPLAH
jgi:hypothetical protein